MQQRIDDRAAALKEQRLAQKQLRLGIVANHVDVSLPFIPPRDVWTRWPKLQSARRGKRTVALTADQKLAQDCVLNGTMLDAFTREMRSNLHAEGPLKIQPLEIKEESGTIRASGRERLTGKGARARRVVLAALVIVLLCVGAILWRLL